MILGLWFWFTNLGSRSCFWLAMALVWVFKQCLIEMCDQAECSFVLWSLTSLCLVEVIRRIVGSQLAAWDPCLDWYIHMLIDMQGLEQTLQEVCEECEELLVEAGRKFRLALSLDRTDMRALYNWGLALCHRAQLISEEGGEVGSHFQSCSSILLRDCYVCWRFLI